MKGVARLSSTRLWTIALGLWVVMCLMPVKRIVASEWTIDVLDETGAPFPDVKVHREWNDDTVFLKGADELSTDDKGRVVFPQHASWRPLLIWVFQAGASAVVNGHGFARSTDYARVDQDDARIELASDTHDFCAEECRRYSRRSTLRVFDARHAESDARQRLEHDGAVLQALAESWAAEPAAAFVSRHEPGRSAISQFESCTWNDWSLFRDGDTHTWMAADGASGARPADGLSLAQAATLAGTTEAHLTSWLERLRKAGVQSLDKGEIPGVVDITFPPGGHGLRYAIRDSQAALATLHAEASGHGKDGHSRTSTHIVDRWFFHADRRP